MKKKLKNIILIAILLSVASFNAQVKNDWVKAFGGIDLDEGSTILTDSNGFVYVSGLFRNTVDFDPGSGVYNLTATGAYSSTFLQKLDSNGNFIWAKSIGSSSWNNHPKIALDKSGNIYMCGMYNGLVDFDPGSNVLNHTSVGGEDIFIEKFDSSGKMIWNKIMGSIGEDHAVSISYNNAGYIYITGHFQDTVDFDPNSGIYNLTAPPSLQSGFIQKLDSSGTFIWAKSFENIACVSLDVDEQGSVYTTGGFGGTTDFDPGSGVYNLTAFSANQSDVFIVKLDSSGNFRWAKRMGGSLGDGGYSIKVDSFNNVYSTGSFTGTVDFNPGIGTYNLDATPYGFYVQKLDSSGNFIWAKGINGGYALWANALTIDKHQNIFTTGGFQNTIDFDPNIGIQNLTSNGYVDGFIQKLDSSGRFIWAKSFGSTGNSDYVNSIAVNKFDKILTTGRFYNTVDFDLTLGILNITSTGIADIFIQKLKQDNCSSIGLTIDSASNTSCIQQGHASSFAFGGASPYTYQWNTSPLTNDSIANFSSSGIYKVTINDTNGCQVERAVLINGPKTITGFDLNTNLISSNLRPGFNATLWLDGFNDGCVPISGELKLVMNNKVIIDSIIPSPDLISGDTLTWNFTNLKFDTIHLRPKIFVTTSTSVTIGDTLLFNSIIVPFIGDIDSTNNFKTYSFIASSGYDPNDKAVYPQGECIEKYVLKNKTLSYTIRFQNTGTAPAQNIYLLDTLDLDFDINTLKVISNSHNIITEVLPGNILKFNFNNINLPDSGTNQILSNGNVVYEIKPKQSVSNGTKVKNTSYIYFDFNPPVKTNTVTNTLIDVIPTCSPLSVKNTISETSVSIFPNPTQNYFTIKVDQTLLGSSYKITDLLGKDLLIGKLNQQSSTFDFSGVPVGIYIFTIIDNPQYHFKVIKE